MDLARCEATEAVFGVLPDGPVVPALLVDLLFGDLQVAHESTSGFVTVAANVPGTFQLQVGPAGELVVLLEQSAALLECHRHLLDLNSAISVDAEDGRVVHNLTASSSCEQP